MNSNCISSDIAPSPRLHAGFAAAPPPPPPPSSSLPLYADAYADAQTNAAPISPRPQPTPPGQSLAPPAIITLAEAMHGLPTYWQDLQRIVDHLKQALCYALQVAQEPIGLSVLVGGKKRRRDEVHQIINTAKCESVNMFRSMQTEIVEQHAGWASECVNAQIQRDAQRLQYDDTEMADLQRTINGLFKV